ncbi:UNKNOWN [Stylonychia lemnae]|uniref:Uncharacterized protein n=1 Tax=Stylonychia lemnae TaxID=5949 RepID=A0A078A653_STYLE|nr:UNKNOWN [Stylonychia lemnae]|eukprot:CDW77730.1 UNKNOWN [Stylonychia lemnae]
MLNFETANKADKTNKKSVSRKRNTVIQLRTQELVEPSQSQNDLMFQPKQQQFDNEELNSLLESKESIENEIISLLTHIFKHHVEKQHLEMQNDRQIYLIKVLINYFTLNQKKNIYLAYFQIIEMTKSFGDSFFSTNIAIINHMFLHQGLRTYEKREDIGKELDYYEIVNLNKLFTQFKISVEQVTEKIKQFWSNIAYEKLEFS